jgi:nucleoside-diphosphate-sugar epimerase
VVGGTTVSQTVLITGAFGLVGSATLERFAADGWQVVATAHHKAGKSLPPGVETRWVDLTDPSQVDRVVSEVSPAAIIHLAAIIPPMAYRDAKLARRVNVDATAALVRAAEAQPNTPRFVHASSGAVYGAPNPSLIDRVCADTPPQPCELYGGHKLEAEQLVRSSNLEWVVLRLGGIYSVDPSAMPFTSDLMYFSSLLPTDGRVHTVDVRDVATAFAAATTADVAGEILLIAGDDSHLLLIGQTASAAVAAQGMPGLLPVGRPGNPERDDAWYPSYWMDVTRAQQALSFQHHSWPDMLAEMRAITGWKRYPMRLLTPVAREILRRRAAYYNKPGRYADPWGAIRAKLGEPGLETEPNAT